MKNSLVYISYNIRATAAQLLISAHCTVHLFVVKVQNKIKIGLKIIKLLNIMLKIT